MRTKQQHATFVMILVLAVGFMALKTLVSSPSTTMGNVIEPIVLEPSECPHAESFCKDIKTIAYGCNGQIVDSVCPPDTSCESSEWSSRCK